MATAEEVTTAAASGACCLAALPDQRVYAVEVLKQFLGEVRGKRGWGG